MDKGQLSREGEEGRLAWRGGENKVAEHTLGWLH